MKRTAYEIALASCDRARRRARQQVRAESALRTAAPAVVPRNWKGAEFSRIYSDWLAGLTSPNDELRSDLRTLRARARELSRNNAFAGAFLELVTTNVIGPHGMRLRAKTRLGTALATEVNSVIEEGWRRWSEGPVTADGRMCLVEFEQLALETVARDGEAFPDRVLGRDFTHGLALRLLDPDLVDESYSIDHPGPGARVFLGVEVDSLGRRLAYHVKDEPYGPAYRGRGRVRRPAEELLHLYRSHRGEQMRGVTWMTRAMAPTKDLERYFQNELVASAAGAAKMGFITNEAGATGALQQDPALTEGAAAEASAGGNRVTVEAEPGTIWELEAGQKFESWNSAHPSTAFESFAKIVLKWMARAYGVSYEALSGDLRDVTYLSGRLGQQMEWMAWTKLQNWWIRSFRQPLFEWWLESAILSGELDLPGADWRLYRNTLWQPRGRDWVDPSKDAQAFEQLLKLRLTSHQRILSQRGDDFVEVLEELEDEQKEAAKRGITLFTETAPGASKPPAKPSGEGSDEDDGAGDGDDDDARAGPSRNGKRGASRDLLRR